MKWYSFLHFLYFDTKLFQHFQNVIGFKVVTGLLSISSTREFNFTSLCKYLFQNFPQVIVIHTVKGFGTVNKSEINVFLELSCFFNDPANLGNLVSGSSAFSKTSLNIWKLTVRILLRPVLENFEQYFTSM